MLLDTVGPEHPATLAASYSLADIGRAVDPEASRERFVDLVPRLQKAFGPIHPNSLRAEFALGLVELHLGEFAQAVERMEGTLQRTLEVPADVVPLRLGISAALTLGHCHLGRRARAQQVLRIMEETLAELGEERTGYGESVVACVELISGQPARAEQTYRRAFERFEEAPLDPSLKGRIHLGHGRSLEALGNTEAALAAYRLAQAALTAVGLAGRFWLDEAAAAEQALDH